MEETYTIHTGTWTRVTRMELMQIPWFYEAAKNFDLVLINSCIGFRIGRIQEGGSFVDLKSNKPMYFEKNVDRLRLVELYWDEDVQSWLALNTTPVRTAEIAQADGWLAVRTGKVTTYPVK